VQVKDNLGCLDFELTSDQLKRLEEKSKIQLGFPHDFMSEEKLQHAFKSRFMEFYLSEYNLQEFLEITKRLLYSRYKLSEEIAAAIADVVWNDIKTKDIRDVLQIAKLARNVDDVQDVARTLMKYRPKQKTE
jgi:hypothetical protein